MIINDGRARVAAAKYVLKEELLAEKGIMMLHDWERKEYKTLIGRGKFRIQGEEMTSRRQTAFLVPYSQTNLTDFDGSKKYLINV